MFTHTCADNQLLPFMGRQLMNLFVSSRSEKWWKQMLVKVQAVTLFKIEFAKYFFFEVSKFSMLFEEASFELCVRK